MYMRNERMRVFKNKTDILIFDIVHMWYVL